MTRPDLYIAGPMRGRPGLNERMFRAADMYARELGWGPVVPHDIPASVHEGSCRPGYDAGQGTAHSGWCHLDADVVAMIGAGSVLLLPGWQSSKGASIEHTIASALELPCYTLDTLPDNDDVVDAEVVEDDVADPLSCSEWWPGADVTERVRRGDLPPDGSETASLLERGGVR